MITSLKFLLFFGTQKSGEILHFKIAESFGFKFIQSSFTQPVSLTSDLRTYRTCRLLFGDDIFGVLTLSSDNNKYQKTNQARSTSSLDCNIFARGPYRPTSAVVYTHTHSYIQSDRNMPAHSHTHMLAQRRLRLMMNACCVSTVVINSSSWRIVSFHPC